MGMLYAIFMIISIILLIGISSAFLKLQSKFYIFKSKNMDYQIDTRYRINLLEADIKTLHFSKEVLFKKIEEMENEKKEPIEHNPLLDYRNDLLKTLTFKKGKIVNVGEFKIWYSELEGQIINVAEDTISIEQEENMYITDKGLPIHKDHIQLI